MAVGGGLGIGKLGVGGGCGVGVALGWGYGAAYGAHYIIVKPEFGHVKPAWRQKVDNAIARLPLPGTGEVQPIKSRGEQLGK